MLCITQAPTAFTAADHHISNVALRAVKHSLYMLSILTELPTLAIHAALGRLAAAYHCWASTVQQWKCMMRR
jgi:hypothetical protein